MAHAWPAYYPAQRAKDQGSSNDRHRPTPVRLTPIKQHARMQYHQQPTKYRPLRWEPCKQQPANGGTRQPYAEPNTNDRMPPDDLSRREYESLCRWILGG